MDPRVIPEQFCGFAPSQYAVVRNAGGRVAHLTSEVAFASAVSDLDDFVIIHHTDCGLANVPNAALRQKLADKGLRDTGTASRDFGEILDLNQSVRGDVAALRASPYVHRRVNIRGYVLELMTTEKMVEVSTSLGQKDHL